MLPKKHSHFQIYHCQKSENPEGQHNILFADSDTMHEVLLSFHIAAHG